MSDPELAQVMARFLPPLANVGEENTLTVTPGGISADVSGKYYHAANKIVDDLSKQSSKLKDPRQRNTRSRRCGTRPPH